jgi:pilus assembly protein Flp/PilA
MTATLMTARRLLADENGATAIEYALLASLIAGVMMAAMLTMGESLSTIFTNANDHLVQNTADPD